MKLEKAHLFIKIFLLLFLCLCYTFFFFTITNDKEVCDEEAQLEFQKKTKICQKKIVGYVPSKWEKSWVEKIGRLKSDDRSWASGCGQLQREKEYIVLFRNISSSLQRERNFLKPTKDNRFEEIFSYHRALDTCSGEEKRLYIEPLVSFLRHPSAVCFDAHTQDKSYLVLPWSTDALKGGKAYFFDVGASLYSSGFGGDSQKWFVDNYHSKNIEFDHIFGWEANVTKPSAQWRAVPSDIKTKTSWFNIPASSKRNQSDNPWTFVRKITKPDDFVVVKIDIDTPAVEIELVLQLLKDPALLELVDEFYFEHHVRGNAMQFRGWGNLKGQKVPYPGIGDSYEIFTNLRKKTHSWV